MCIMSKLLKIVVIIVLGLVIIVFSGIYFVKQNTKKHSPEQTITHTVKDATFTVYYNQPYKNNRVIFGDLVPYGEVWRTGANEATTFTSDKDISVDGTTLEAGTYTLWTIPNPESWKVIFNSKAYSWGVHMDGTPTREIEFDVLTVEVPTQPLLNIVEQFSIYFENANDFTILYLAWDRTAIAVPIKVK